MKRREFITLPTVAIFFTGCLGADEENEGDGKGDTDPVENCYTETNELEEVLKRE